MNSAPGLASDISASFTWYGAKTLPAELGLGFLAHRRPGVGVDRVGAGDRVGRVGEQPQPRAVARDARRLLHGGMRQLIAVRAGDVEVDAEHRRGVRERHGDVVAVADVRERPAAQRAPVLAQREEVATAPGTDARCRSAR